MLNLGIVKRNSIIRIPFSSNLGTGARSGFSTALETSDIEIYDDDQVTQRSSSAGLTLDDTYDTLVGLHELKIDLSDNTDAGFYKVNTDYKVALYPDETLDGVSVSKWICRFRIGTELSGYVGGMAYFDKDAGSAGALGTIDDPCSIESEVFTIADGLSQKIGIRGAFALSVGHTDYEFIALDGTAVITGSAGVDLNGCILRDLEYTGLIKAENNTRWYDCYVHDVTTGDGFAGKARRTEFGDTIKLNPDQESFLHDCFENPTNPTFTFTDSANQHHLHFMNYNGHAHISEMEHISADVHIRSNELTDITMNGSCVGGNLEAGGKGNLQIDAACVFTSLDLGNWEQNRTTPSFGTSSGAGGAGAGTSFITLDDNVLIDKALYVDNYFNDNYVVYITEGAGAGQIGTCKKYTDSSLKFEVYENWGTAPSATSVYVIFHQPAANLGVGVDLGDGTSIAQMLTAMAGKTADAGSYARANDSQEAIRDRGDAAWITAVGFSTLTAAQVNTEVDNALSDIHLDHLFAVDYDPASKPGVATALLNELIESDSGVSRYTANALEQGPVATGFSTHSAADVWAVATRILTASTNFNDLSAAQVNAEVDTALSDIGLDHLISAAVLGADVADNSIIAKLVSKEVTADWDDFVNTTESLQAIRDRGDSNWITATGFSTLTPAQVNAEVVDVMTVDTIADLGVGLPPAAPSIAQALMYRYSSLRNKIVQTDALQQFYNDAGALIFKKTITPIVGQVTFEEAVTG